MNKIKKNLTNIIKMCRVFYLVSYLIIFAIPVSAQTAETLSVNNEAKDSDISADFNLYAETGFEYDDNVYRLSEYQELLYKENDPGDLTSGRFKDMDSLSDYIVEPLIGIKFKSKSPLGGNFRLKSWLKYNYYIKNDKCRFPEARIKLEHPVLNNSDLSLEGNFLYGFFKKNYLSGAYDIDQGNINRSERIYSPAVYNEFEAILAYEHKFIEKRDNILSGMSVQPFVGCRYRIYNSTFGNRNQNVAIMGLALNLELASRADINTAYTYENILCPGNEELILVDENSAGSDINDDNELHDNAPLITKIDRSCGRHIIEVKPSFELTEHWQLFAGYKLRKTIYSEKNKLDIERYNQKKDYWQMKAGMKYEFLKDLSGQIEFIHTEENDNEDGKYSQNSYIAAIKYDFI